MSDILHRHFWAPGSPSRSRSEVFLRIRGFRKFKKITYVSILVFFVPISNNNDVAS